MSKIQSKKGTERRKKARPSKRVTPTQAASITRERSSGKASKSTSGRVSANAAIKNEEECHLCSKGLKKADRALFVEEEIGRVFCSEDCITAFFTPEIERLEKEYFANLSRGDLSDDEKDKFSHLRWITLQDPDEVWREKTLAGDYRYTLISEFQPGSRGIWSVCICLFLRGEPSFLYLAFPTKNAAMVNNYRRGERVQWEKPKQPKPGKASGKSQAKKELREPRSSRDSSDRTPQNPVASDMSSPSQTDGLAEAWTEDDVQRAQLVHERQEDDIPTEEFEDYQRCMDETLETPDEVWVLMGKDEEDRRIFHFMRHYPDEKPNRVWFVIVARETETDEEIEILDAFPTRDPKLVECYRRGDQQIGIRETRNPSRVVH